MTASTTTMLEKTSIGTLSQYFCYITIVFIILGVALGVYQGSNSGQLWAEIMAPIWGIGLIALIVLKVQRNRKLRKSCTRAVSADASAEGEADPENLKNAELLDKIRREKALQDVLRVGAGRSTSQAVSDS